MLICERQRLNRFVLLRVLCPDFVSWGSLPFVNRVFLHLCVSLPWPNPFSCFCLPVRCRACRLKKKAQHEANKIKLWGLNQEYGQFQKKKKKRGRN